MKVNSAADHRRPASPRFLALLAGVTLAGATASFGQVNLDEPSLGEATRGETSAAATAATVNGDNDTIDHSPWSWSIHAGLAEPASSLSKDTTGGFGLALDLEYAFNSDLALELVLGLDELDGKRQSPDIDVTHLSMDLRWYIGGTTVRPFVLGGLGTYAIDPGPSELGLQLGAGLQLPLWSRVGLEFEGRYHSVDTSPDDFEWISLRLGFRFRP